MTSRGGRAGAGREASPSKIASSTSPVSGLVEYPGDAGEGNDLDEIVTVE
jgi:hypothetical protein